MRAFTILCLSILLTGILATPLGASGHCTNPSTSVTTLGTPTVIVAQAGTNYLVAHAGVAPNVVLVQLYEESNGVSGLQRRDFGADDTCHGQVSPDRIVL